MMDQQRADATWSALATIRDEKVVLRKGRYSNGRVAIQAVCADGEPYCTVTVNLPDEPLADDEVFVKDYSENEGVLDAMEAAGVLRRTGRAVESGYAIIPVAKLLV